MAVIPAPSSNSAHWYRKDAVPCHTVQLSDGSGTRPTNLGDARKMSLYPSVSAKLRVLDKPGLDTWRIKEAIKSALRLPKTADESDAYYIKRVLSDSEQIKVDAGVFGTQVHHELETYIDCCLGGTPYTPNAVTGKYVAPIVEWMRAKGIRPVATEVRVLNYEHGFGGTADLPCEMPGGACLMLDYKTKRTKPGEALEPFVDQAMQIAAYAETYWGPRFAQCWGINLYISSTEPGRIECAVYSPEMLADCWQLFTHLCELWRHLNEYDPRQPDRVFHVATMRVISAPFELPAPPAPEAPAALPEPALVVPAPVLAPAMVDESLLQRLCNAQVLHFEADGIEFLHPMESPDLVAARVESAYSYWYNAKESLGAVGLTSDRALRGQGWVPIVPAFAKDLADATRVENAGAETKVDGVGHMEVGAQPKVPAKKRLSRSKAAIAVRKAARGIIT